MQLHTKKVVLEIFQFSDQLEIFMGQKNHQKVQVHIIYLILLFWLVPLIAFGLFFILDIGQNVQSSLIWIMGISLIFLLFFLALYLKLYFEKITYAMKEKSFIFDHLSDVVVYLGTEGEVFFSNPAIREVLGKDKKDIIGQPFETVIQIVGEASMSVVDNTSLFDKLFSKQKTHTGKYYVAIQNTTKPVLITFKKIYEEDEHVGTLFIIRDITKDATIDEMKKEYISVASHQLRGPLSTLKWYSDLFQSDKFGKLTSKQKEYMSRMCTSVQRMIYLVDDFLDVSRIESGRFSKMKSKQMNPVELVKNILETQEYMIKEKKLEVRIEDKSKFKTIKANPEVIREIYTNILTNAIKYTEDKGKISIKFFSEKDDLITEFSDTGIGIPKKEQELVFSKFFRGDNVVEAGWQGTGLGLYAVKQLVEQCSGDISFLSEEGKGTTFWIRFKKK